MTRRQKPNIKLIVEDINTSKNRSHYENIVIWITRFYHFVSFDECFDKFKSLFTYVWQYIVANFGTSILPIIVKYSNVNLWKYPVRNDSENIFKTCRLILPNIFTHIWPVNTIQKSHNPRIFHFFSLKNGILVFLV